MAFRRSGQPVELFLLVERLPQKRTKRSCRRLGQQVSLTSHAFAMVKDQRCAWRLRHRAKQICFAVVPRQVKLPRRFVQIQSLNIVFNAELGL